MKFILTCLAISCPIPAGLFTPTFTLGAVFGRLYGYFFNWLFPSLQIQEGIYAVIGAATFTSCVTRTTSVAMIIFELNGQITHLVPVLISVLVAYAIGNSMSMGIFDVLLDMKGLPYLPSLRSVDTYSMKAADIMNRNFIYITEKSNFADIVVLLQHIGPRPKSIPVLKDD